MSLSEDQIVTLYRSYGHLVLRRCQILLRDAALGEDALQEVFVRLLKYGDAVAQAEAPLRWVYRVADRVCFDMLDRRKRQPLGEDFLPASVTDPGDLSSDVANRAVVLRLLARFDAKTRTVAVLYFVDGLSQDRIAKETGWSRQTVNKKIGEIRTHARAFLTTPGGAS